MRFWNRLRGQRDSVKTSLAAIPFAEAASLWLETRKPYLAPSSFSDYKHYIKRLSALKRAKELGSVEPEHYLLPFRPKTGAYDPTRPMKGWRTADEEICAAAGVKFRRYDWRHTAATRLLENPKVSTETAIAILGHVSEKMVRRVYNHTRYQAMMEALESLDKKKAPQPVRLPDRRFRSK